MITFESKVKSPWNPIKLAPLVVVLSISEDVTGIRTTPEGEGAIVATGKETVIGNKGREHPFGGVAVGVKVAVAVAVDVAVAVAVGAPVAVAVGETPGIVICPGGVVAS